jgi:hypothetical protein
VIGKQRHDPVGAVVLFHARQAAKNGDDDYIMDFVFDGKIHWKTACFRVLFHHFQHNCGSWRGNQVKNDAIMPP